MNFTLFGFICWFLGITFSRDCYCIFVAPLSPTLPRLCTSMHTIPFRLFSPTHPSPSPLRLRTTRSKQQQPRKPLKGQIHIWRSREMGWESGWRRMEERKVAAPQQTGLPHKSHMYRGPSIHPSTVKCTAWLWRPSHSLVRRLTSSRSGENDPIIGLPVDFGSLRL